MNKGAVLSDVTSIIYLRGDSGFDGKAINVKTCSIRKKNELDLNLYIINQDE